MSELDMNFNEQFDINTQKKIISLFIYDQQWAELNAMDVILPEYFVNPILRNVCSWFHKYYGQYKKFPTKDVLLVMTQDFVNDNGLDIREYYNYEKLILEIFKLDINDDIKFFRDKAIEFAKTVAWKKALAKGSNIITSNNNVEKAVEEFRKVLMIGQEVDMGLDFEKVTFDDYLDLLRDAYDESSMIKTGIPSWDRALGGGFVKRNIHIIGAPPGNGKSRTMAFLTKKALEDHKKVVFISLELSEQEVMSNIMSAITKYGMNDHMRIENYEILQKKHIDFKNKYKANLMIKFFNPGSVHADNVANYIKSVSNKKSSEQGREWKPDVIYIDYMDKMIPTQKVKGNLYEDVGGIATDCKNLAITFDCPVITASQLGKTTWNLTGNQVVGMDAVAESSAKTHICHSLTTVNVTPVEKQLDKCRLYVAKSRSGITGEVIYCDRSLKQCLITEAAEPWKVEELVASVGYEIKDGTKK